MKFQDLNKKQKNKVERLYNILMKDKSMDCRRLHKDINDFWESHKEQDFPQFLKSLR